MHTSEHLQFHCTVWTATTKAKLYFEWWWTMTNTEDLQAPYELQELLQRFCLSAHVIQQNEAGVLTYFSHLSYQISFCFNDSSYWSYKQSCRYKTYTKHFQEIKLIQLPMIRIGGNGQLTGVVMATTASFCFKFNLVSRMSLHCLYKRTQYHTLSTFIWQEWALKIEAHGFWKTRYLAIPKRTLLNKQHFIENKTETMQHVLKEQLILAA